MPIKLKHKTLKGKDGKPVEHTVQTKHVAALYEKSGWEIQGDKADAPAKAEGDKR